MVGTWLRPYILHITTTRKEPGIATAWLYDCVLTFDHVVALHRLLLTMESMSFTYAEFAGKHCMSRGIVSEFNYVCGGTATLCRTVFIRCKLEALCMHLLLVGNLSYFGGQPASMFSLPHAVSSCIHTFFLGVRTKLTCIRFCMILVYMQEFQKACDW